MSDIKNKAPQRSLHKRTITSRLLNLLTMVTMLSWANSAWAEASIKEVNGTNTTWDFTKVTEAMCADLSSGNWTHDTDKKCYKSNANAGDESPAFMDGLKVNTCGTDKSRVYYDGQGYCFNGGSAYIIIPVTPGKELAVYSAQQIKSNDVTLTASGGAYVAVIPEGKTSVKIMRNSGATYVTKIELRDPLPTLDTSFEATAKNTPDGWTAVQLPSVTFHSDVTLEGLSSTANNRETIQKAIDAASTAGGGIVRIPAGTWLSGPIVMKSNVVLHLNEGATLQALPFGGVDYDNTSLDGDSYPYSGSNNTSELKNYNTFITCASGVQNVVIEGDGNTSIIDGQGAGWWPSYKLIGTRPPLIRFDNGSKFLVRNLKLQNSPGVNLTLGNGGAANNFTVHDVTISNPSSEADQLQTGEVVSHNTDGIPVWGPYANIYDCNISTGDDNIVADSHAHHLHAWNIKCGYGHGMSMGSYTEDLHDVIYEDITFTNTSCGFRLKTNTGRSGNDTKGSNGAVKNIICRNATMTGVPSPIKITSWYDSDKETPADVSTPSAVEDKTPEFCNILFQNITADAVAGKTQWKHNSPIYLYGRPEMPIHNVTFDNVKINSKRGAFFAYCDDIKFINGSNVTNETEPSKPIATYYDVTNVTGGFKASNLALVEGKESQSLSQGDTYTLTKGTDYTTTLGNGDITFESSNTRVATVDENGKITAVGAGTATITIKQASTIEYADKSLEVTVTVAAVPITIYSWESPKGTVIETGGTIAYVNGDGDRLNYANGAYYTVCLNGNKAKLTDETPSAAAGHMVITFDEPLKAGDEIILTSFYNKGEDRTVSAWLVFENGTTASSATVNHSADIAREGTPEDITVKVPDAADGSNTLIMTRNDGGTNMFITKIVIKGIRENKETSDLTAVNATKTMGVGEEYTLAATTDYTTSSTGAITYESSDDAVATVSDAGVITAVSAGTATITIKQAADATYAAGSCEIALTVSAPSYTFGIGRTESNGSWSGEVSTGEKLKGTAPDGVIVTVANTETTNGLSNWQDAVHGSESTLTIPNAHRGVTNGATATDGPLGFKVEIPSGKKLNISNISYDVFTRKGKNTAIKVQIRTGSASGNVVYELANTVYSANSKTALSKSTIDENGLQRLDGIIYVQLYYAENTSSPYIALKDFNITATLEDAPARTFTDFQIDFTKDWANKTSIAEGQTYYITATTADGVPTMTTTEPEKYLATFKGKYHGNIYGVYNTTLTVPVDGPVKFTYGASDQGNTVTGKNSEGNTVVEFSNYSSTGKWNNTDKIGIVGSKAYNSETPTTITLTIADNKYVPYIKVEACDFIPLCEKPKETKGAYVAGTTSWTYTLASATASANIKYTVNGGDEQTINSASGDVQIPYGATVVVWAFDPNGALEESEKHQFTAAAQPQLVAPTIACDDNYQITIKQNDKTEGAKTYYTIDGTDPTAESTEYTAAFSISENKTIKAITILAGYINSAIASESITFKALKPVVKMADDKKNVTLTNREQGATVYYTTDGSTPTAEHYTGSFTSESYDITLTGDCQIKAITVKEGVPSSDVVTYFCRVAFHDINWDLTGNTPLLGTSKSDFTTGVIVEADGTTHLCDKDDPSASIVVKTKWNDKQHGYSGWTASIPVDGNVDIYLGNCQYGGGTMTIKPKDGEAITLQQLGKTGTVNCYDGDKTKNFNVAHYVGGPTTLEITSSGIYVPYFAVKDTRRASDLTIKGGKENINIPVNESYTLTKDVDYTGSASSLTYTSSNPEIATVDATGKITAGANYGMTVITVSCTDAAGAMKPGEIRYIVRVISSTGQTHKPTVAIAEDGAVTITSSSDDENPAFYYTLDGTEPTESSASVAGVIPAIEANGHILKVIATTDDKSPSDVVTAYVNVTGDIVWRWNEGGGNVNLVPTISPSIKDALNSNTQAVIGNMLNSSWADVNNKGKFAAFQPQDKTTTLDEQHTVLFNIIPVVGVQFKPTAITFDASRVGTDGGSMDAKLMCGTTVYDLLQNQKPDRSNASTGPTYTSFTPDVSAIPASDNEWALQMYIYNLNNTAKYALSNISVSGTFTGVEYDGIFYSITTSTNPAEGGSVRHVPSSSKIAAGKDATFIATPSIGYRFTHWTYLDQTESIGTEKTLVVSSLDQNVDVEAHFEKLPYITFECNNSSVQGTVPQSQYVNEDRTYFIPYNYTLYRPKSDGAPQRWSVTAWTDGENVYQLGSVQTFTKDTKLTPVLTSTEKDITDVNASTTVRWNFDTKEDPHMAPALEISAEHNDLPFSYTKQVDVAGEKLDIKMDIDVTAGKFTSADARIIGLDGLGAQINNGTKFVLPAVDGMIVRVKASKKTDTLQEFNSQGDFGDGSTVNITFGGASGTVKDNKTLECTYTGEGATLDVVFVEAGTKVKSSNNRTGTWGFYEYIEVVYPVLPDVLLANKIVTTPLLSDKELDVNAGSVEKSATAHTNTGSRYKDGDQVTITAEAKYGYYISAIKSGDTSLTMTKVLPDANAPQPTKATATYTVGATTGTVTVEYERLSMSKVRLETADAKLGDVDFASGSIHENFYTKGEGWVESWFVVGNTETAISVAADDYVTDKWTQGTADGTQVSTTNQYTLDVTAGNQIFVAHFKHGEMGNVIFDIENPVIVDGTSIENLPDDFGDKYDANSLAPAKVTNSYSFTIPKYHTVFKTGYTLKFWKNKENYNTYALGNNYSFQTNGETITLVPVYEANPSDQNNRTNDPVMLYEFGTGKGIRAQQVRYEKNTETYWTAQVHVETITDGNSHPHDRDVAMWVSTGEKGFIRNGDLPEWAAFGPGTTFTIASCAGTKVEMLSYAPMTTTTFGGKPFTLVSEDKEKHEYVYECVTELTEARVPIVIGDDYSYYKYIKVYSKKANRVNLHVGVDDKSRGRIKSIEAINTSVEDPILELEDGGNSFHQGNSVMITFKRRFGLEFDKIVDLDKTVDGKPFAVLEMCDNGKVKMVKMGNGTEREEVAANADNVSWGSTETLADHVFYLKKIEPNADEDMVDSLRTTYEVHFNITTHRNLQICFKEKPTYYVTYNAGKLATGVPPAAAWIEAGDEFTVPVNHTLYYEGYTLKYWTDSEYDASKDIDDPANEGHVYRIEQSYKNSGSDLLLYPVFEPNTFGLLDIPDGDGLKVTWPFAKNLGAPYINFEHSSGILVSQLKKSETEWIDMVLRMDGSDREDANGGKIYGKFNNTSSADRCQINNNSVITFPTTNGCEITLSALKEISTTQIAGMTDGNGYTKGKEVTATYDGNESSQTVNFTSDGGYYSKFEVTYKPQNITRPVLASVKYGSTALSDADLQTLITEKSITVNVNPNVENDVVPEVTATATNGVSTVTQATIDNRSAVIALKTEGGVLAETYNVKFNFNVPETAPKFIRYVINGKEYEEGQRNITVDNAPVSGTVTLKFDHTMSALSITSPVYGTTYSAEQGKDLVFHYWNLPVGTDSYLQFPASILRDVYGGQVVDEDNDGNPNDFINIHLKVSSTSMPVEHRTFNYIVGTDGDINSAIAAANSADGNDRYYVFIPDGEYELTGNESIVSRITSDGVAPADSTGANRTDLLDKTVENHMTQITRANVSLIGQSTKGVTLFNRPLLEGISYTATIHIGKKATDFYAEDLQLVNRFPYWKSMNSQGGKGAGRAVAFWDQGNRSIMKNVELWSYQDTYYSSNANADYRGYFENCTVAGVVDWLCGDGNIWLEKCDIVIRDRAGNNIAAPSQENTQQWGYVFNECNIRPEVDNPVDLKDKNWSLARPWANAADKSPAATYLNTKMWLKPRDAGWEKMGTGAILRFHEYRTMDKSGTLVSLGSRSLAACAPGPGSDDCILSAADAAKYTIESVMGGSDMFTPKAFTQQIDAKSATDGKDKFNSIEWVDVLELDDDVLSWNVNPMALCYFIFKVDEATGKMVYVTNVAQTSDDTRMGVSLERLGRGEGLYCVRAANQRGGLGAATELIRYKESTKYELEIRPLEGNEVAEGYGWTTICLPYNAKKPLQNVNGEECSELKVFAVNGKGYNVTTTKYSVSDYSVYLTSVDIMNENEGYLIYGPVGKYQFSSTNHTTTIPTILKGNPTDEQIAKGNNNGYVLANKPTTWGLGFYKYTGDWLAAHRAWLPIEFVTPQVESVLSNNARAIKFIFTDDELTGILNPIVDFSGNEVIYDLQGQRIVRSQMRKGSVYIINGKKQLVK